MKINVFYRNTGNTLDWINSFSNNRKEQQEKQRNYEKLTSKETKYLMDAISGKLKVRSVRKAKEVLETANKLQGWNTEYIKVSGNTYRTMDVVEALDKSIVEYYKMTRHKSSVKKLLEKNIDTEEMDAIPELANILDRQAIEEQQVITQARADVRDHEQNVRRSVRFKERKTAQFIPTLKGTFGSLLDMKEIRENVNMASFSEMLQNMNYKDLKELYINIRNISEKNNKDSRGGYYYTPFNIGELKKLFIEKGYKPDGIFGGEEMGSLVSLIESYYITQSRIHSMNLRDRFSILLDFDRNGILTTDKNFYVGELQMDFEIFDSLTSDGVKALIKNLGLGSVRSFSREMANNLLVAREKFQRALGVAIERGISPAELVVYGGVVKANKEIYKKQETVSEKVSKKVDEYIRSRLGTIADKQAVKALKLEAIGLMVGSNTGVGASFDIRKMNAFFDSIQLGVVNGVPGFALSKELLKKNGFNVTWTQANLFIPIITAAKTFEHNPKLRRLFANDIEGGVDVSAFVSMAPGALVFGVNAERIDAQTSKGIERMVSRMSGTLNRIIHDVMNGKGFENSSYYRKSKYKVLDKKVYEEIRAFYNTYAKGKSYRKAIMRDLKNAYLSYYRTKLYTQAEGTRLTSFGGGIALLAGFLPIPYLVAGGEHISQNWKEVIHNVNRQETVTYTSAEKLRKRFKIEQVTYNGVKALKIPNDRYNFNISAPNGEAEVERKGKFVYVAGTFHNLKINHHSDHEKVVYTIVLNGGQKDKNGLYIPVRKEKPIRTSIDALKDESKELTTKNVEALKNTKELREWLFKVIGPDTLTHKKTPGMMKLQRMIFNLQNGKGSINRVWRQFEKAFSNNKFMEYLAEKGIHNVPAFKAKTEEEKMLVLQSVNANFMKKTKLQDTDNNGKINVGENQTIMEYDKKHRRDIYFNRLFAKKFPHLLGEIKQARKEWYAANANAKEYTFKPVLDGSIAFTGVESKYRGRTNIRGIMPYVGAYNIASIEGGKDFVEIDGKSAEVINALPKTFLKQIRRLLNENGVHIRTLKGVKNFINKGGNDKVQIDYKLAFAKMGECLNDAIILKDLTIKVKGQEIKIGATSSASVYMPDPSVVKFGVVWTGEKREDTDDKPEEDEGESNPGEDGEPNEDGDNSGGTPGDDTDPNNPNNTPDGSGETTPGTGSGGQVDTGDKGGTTNTGGTNDSGTTNTGGGSDTSNGTGGSTTTPGGSGGGSTNEID